MSLKLLIIKQKEIIYKTILITIKRYFCKVTKIYAKRKALKMFFERVLPQKIQYLICSRIGVRITHSHKLHQRYFLSALKKDGLFFN